MLMLDYIFNARKWSYDFPAIYVIARKAKHDIYAAVPGGKSKLLKPKWKFFVDMPDVGTIWTDALFDAKWSSFIWASWHRDRIIEKYGDVHYTYALKKLHWWNLLWMQLVYGAKTTAKKMCSLERLHT